MTLDEAIKHCEEVAHQNEILMKRYDDASGYNRSHNEKIRTNGAKGCEQLISIYRQLAEWLRELKIHREIHDVLLQLLVDFDLDMCCEDLMDNEEEQKICEENCTNNSKGCWVRWAKLKAREVNADG